MQYLVLKTCKKVRDKTFVSSWSFPVPINERDAAQLGKAILDPQSLFISLEAKNDNS